jgi:hypothetical protein
MRGAAISTIAAAAAVLSGQIIGFVAGRMDFEAAEKAA